MILGILDPNWWTEKWINIVLGINKFFMNVLASLFNNADSFYGVFATLAGATDIFDESIYGKITSGLYAIFGVAVLFILAYNFLLIVIDPDKSSGELSVGKTLIQIAVTLLMIVLLKPIFQIANGVTGSIIEQNSIAQIIFGGGYTSRDCLAEYPPGDDTSNANRLSCYDTSAEDGNLCSDEKDADNRLVCYDNQSIMLGKNSGVSPMRAVLIDVFSFFFTPDSNVPDHNSDGIVDAKDVYLHTSNRNGGPYASSWVKCPAGLTNCTLYQVTQRAKLTGNYTLLYAFASNYHHASEDKVDGIEFHFFLGVASAIYIIYILVLFSFDLAVRVIKIGFYQIVAPLCIACRIMPGPKKDIYKKWRSVTIKEYCLVFIRVFALCLGIFIISLMGTLLSRVTYPGYCGDFCKTMVKLFLVLGILTFVKQMPKVIDDLLGGDTGLMGTVKDKLKDAAAGAKSLMSLPLGAGAAGAAGIKGIGRGIKRAQDKIADRKKAKEANKKAQSKLDKAKALHDAGKIDDKALEKAQKRARDAKKANRRARTSMLSSFAGVGTGALSSMGRSLSRSTGLSEAISDVTKDFKNARLNAESSASAAMNAANRRDSRVKNFQEWADKYQAYKEAGGLLGYYKWKRNSEKGNKQLENALAPIKQQIDAVAGKIDTQNMMLESAQASYDASKLKVSNAKAKMDNIALEHDQLQTQEMEVQARLDAQLAAKASGQPYDQQAIDDYESKLDVLHKQIDQKAIEHTQAVDEYTSVSAAESSTIQGYETMEAERDRLVKEQETLKKELETETISAKARITIDGESLADIETKFKEIKTLKEASADADLVVKALVTNITGSGTGAIDRETKINKILDEVDGDFLASFKEMAKKRGKSMGVEVAKAADAIFDQNTENGKQAAALVKALSKDKYGESVSKETYEIITSALSRAIDDKQFRRILEDNNVFSITVDGVDVPIDDKVISTLRTTVQEQMSAFKDKQDKLESGAFYDELLEYERTGRTDGFYGAVIRECLALEEMPTEFSAALTTAKDKSKTYAAMDPSLANASNEQLKTAHDERKTELDRLSRANATSVGAEKMRGVVSGNDDKK